MITFRLPCGWKATKEKYKIENDQKLRNIKNFITPVGKVVSLFVMDTPGEDGIRIMDNMIRDYKKITDNLYLIMYSKLKIKEKNYYIYIVGDKVNKTIMAHANFILNGLAFSFIFEIDEYVPKMSELIQKDYIMKDVIEFFKEQK